MSIDHLKKRILEDAQAQARRIETDMAAQKQEHEQRIAAAARAIEQGIIDRATAEAKSKSQQLTQASDLAAKAHVLSIKQAALDALGETFTKHLNSQANNEAQRMIEKLMTNIPPKSKGEIIAGALMMEIVKSVAKKKSFTVSSQTIPNEGGFIFRGERQEYNCLTSHLVKELMVRHRAKFAQTLFS